MKRPRQTKTIKAEGSRSMGKFSFPKLSERRKIVTDIGLKSISKLNPRPYLSFSGSKQKKPAPTMAQRFNSIMKDIEDFSVTSTNITIDKPVPENTEQQPSPMIASEKTQNRNLTSGVKFQLEVKPEKSSVKGKKAWDERSVATEMGNPSFIKTKTDDNESLHSAKSSSRLPQNFSSLSLRKSPRRIRKKKMEIHEAKAKEAEENSEISARKEAEEKEMKERLNEMQEFIKKKVKKWKLEDEERMQMNKENMKKIGENEKMISDLEKSLARLVKKETSLRERIEGLRFSAQESINALAREADLVTESVADAEHVILSKEQSLKEETHRERAKWEETLRMKVKHQIAPKEQSCYDIIRQLQSDFMKLKLDYKRSMSGFQFMEAILHNSLALFLTSFGQCFAFIMRIFYIAFYPFFFIFERLSS